MDQNSLKLYGDLASWWPLVSAPSEYAEEAAFFRQVLDEAGEQAPHTVLELGSGGGNNASHLKTHYQMTLVDQSTAMLAVSRRLNPECDHRQGDMRTVRLGERFDAVFIHDAIDYMTTESDLRKAIETAYIHCRTGGVALFAPDYVRENFVEDTDHGGHDGEGRSLRYLEWTYDPDENDTTYTVDYAFMLRDRAGQVQLAHDRHVCGLFGREEWLRWLSEAGFKAHAVVDTYARELFVAVRLSQENN